MTEQIKNLILALEKNNIDVIFAETKQDVQNAVRSILPEGCNIAAGGSVSVVESGVWDIIKEPKYCFMDRNREGITPEERLDVFRKTVGCDYYFCSANAVTQKGELINVDGFGNRVASIAFGPQKVIAIVGINKIVKDVTEGLLRIKQVAAPKNAVRLKIDLPCAKLGHCISLEKCDNPDFTDGCNHQRRICASYLISGRQQVKGRITVILCNEELGY